MHSMALHITRDAAHAAELADSLFAISTASARAMSAPFEAVFYTGAVHSKAGCAP